jgi:flagellar basal-body rod modification protein FlgD
MTSAITGTQYTGTATGGTANRTTGGDLDRDAFLKLLVAQLKYQDPSNPTDNTQFLAQTAQYTMVDKINQMVASVESGQASNMVGRIVTYCVDENGKPTNAADARSTRTGTVTSAMFSGTTQTLRVGDADVPMSSVREVTTRESFQESFQASSLLGRKIIYGVDADGRPAVAGSAVATRTGAVSAVSFSGSIPILRVGNTDVPLSSVREVHATAG